MHIKVVHKSVKIKFSKMHGLGNDFIIINAMMQKTFPVTSNIIQNLSNRYTGIGFDQLLLVENSKNVNIDFHYRIFNANGTEVSQCGNGARCFALFVLLKKLTKKRTLYVSTNTTTLILNVLNNGNVCVDMGVPCFKLKNIFGENIIENSLHSIKFVNKIINYDLVSIGNPHCIIYVNNLKKYPVKKIGFYLSTHKIFPEGINVNFVEVLSKNEIALRVYERGVGETLACGSGACASVALGIQQGLLFNEVQVNLLNGILKINWKGGSEKLYMTGPAVHVYDGYFYL
ncbi:diaminopimelate epimerase [Buchnera aphidicola str. Bp (Baizongia pistaciae)]|uniref:Diaminopimelate epimerase n=1 Tax=Buchnera aphidicola subsp. Baizongia pistaciae (strain Bp) TaxID=224915 RepID=DAPF_BUCBP|nr:diaminopimelate epimerase [Buchnera aphidicola]P59582.1 RecName: Full=Diaminopimelate epimerase; Short=DAP epimerase; AltName: Full=PLP-independent amino acid racemase [Buchnera aphidicola str. Bp (Baizongia pistaciae)]AAO27235.1 diaminopimelate epimerase [Buchnera aphidicola str. Bp (Baizongia pistaciae)]